MITLTTKEPPTGETVTITIDAFRVRKIEGGTQEMQDFIRDVSEAFEPEGYVPNWDLALAHHLGEYFPGDLAGDLEIESDPDRIY